jgi:hypothetical protein
LRKNLATGKSSGRKFLLTYHIYPGAKYSSKSKELLFDKFTEPFFEILQTYQDSIVLEIAAHDHYTDLRYHTSDTNHFHNMLVAPGVSPINGQNPGYATFEVDEVSLLPQNLQL